MPDPQRVYEIFSDALRITDEEGVRKFVEDACQGDAALFDEVWSLCLAERRVRHEEDQIRPGHTTIGNYRIVRQIGRGLFACVYLASHRVIGNNAAVKVFKKSAMSVEGEQVWRRDPDILSLLKHDSIVQYFDAGFAKGKIPYVIMEFVEGVHIDKYCDSHRLSIYERLKLFRELCGIIQYVHENNVIHLDLKPANILVTTLPEGRIKLIDFSAGKLLKIRGSYGHWPASQFSIAGTPDYASPEQINEEHTLLGPPSDVYSLGALLYGMMTGYTPLEFDKDTSPEEMRRIITKVRPLPPSKRITQLEAVVGKDEVRQSAAKPELKVISNNRSSQPQQLAQLLIGDIDSIVMKCLEKERGRRYQSAAELSADIDNFLCGRPVKARGGHWHYRLIKFSTRMLGADATLSGWPRWRTPVTRISFLAVMSLVLSALVLAWYAPRANPLLPWRYSSYSVRVASINDQGQVTEGDKRREHLIQLLGKSTRPLDLVLIPSTSTPFWMGALETDASAPDNVKLLLPQETPLHPVIIKPFYLGKVEVTQDEWRAIASLPQIAVELPEDPSEIKGKSLPVTNITYTQAVEFCERLSLATGLKYRLPTEAEWEYACRAGTPTIYGFGNQLTRGVATFGLGKDMLLARPLTGDEIRVANPFGLFNMNGNVWEWTQDRFHPNYIGAPEDAKAWETIITSVSEENRPVSNEASRVLRGGSYSTPIEWCRCSARTAGRSTEEGSNKNTGFRVALIAN